MSQLFCTDCFTLSKKFQHSSQFNNRLWWVLLLFSPLIPSVYIFWMFYVSLSRNFFSTLKKCLSDFSTYMNSTSTRNIWTVSSLLNNDVVLCISRTFLRQCTVICSTFSEWINYYLKIRGFCNYLQVAWWIVIGTLEILNWCV